MTDEDETQADFKIGEEQSERIDLLPAERAYELQKQLVEEIIDSGWDK